MEKHNYNDILKFVHLDEIKELKETNPNLFSLDGIGTSTIEIDNGQKIPVYVDDVIRACELFINDSITSFQIQQWAEWIHMMDFFDVYACNDNDDFLINQIINIDMLEDVEKNKQKEYIMQILNNLKNHK